MARRLIFVLFSAVIINPFFAQAVQFKNNSTVLRRPVTCVSLMSLFTPTDEAPAVDPFEVLDKVADPLIASKDITRKDIYRINAPQRLALTYDDPSAINRTEGIKAAFRLLLVRSHAKDSPEELMLWSGSARGREAVVAQLHERLETLMELEAWLRKENKDRLPDLRPATAIDALMTPLVLMALPNLPNASIFEGLMTGVAASLLTGKEGRSNLQQASALPVLKDSPVYDKTYLPHLKAQKDILERGSGVAIWSEEMTISSRLFDALKQGCAKGSGALREGLFMSCALQRKASLDQMFSREMRNVVEDAAKTAKLDPRWGGTLRVRIDDMLVIDPTTREPELATFMRIYPNTPPAPKKPKKAKAPAESKADPIWLPGLNPVPTGR